MDPMRRPGFASRQRPLAAVAEPGIRVGEFPRASVRETEQDVTVPDLGGAAGRRAREGIVKRPADALAGAEFKRLAAIEFDAAAKSGEGARFPVRSALAGTDDCIRAGGRPRNPDRSKNARHLRASGLRRPFSVGTP